MDPKKKRRKIAHTSAQTMPNLPGFGYVVSAHTALDQIRIGNLNDNITLSPSKLNGRICVNDRVVVSCAFANSVLLLLLVLCLCLCAYVCAICTSFYVVLCVH